MKTDQEGQASLNIKSEPGGEYNQQSFNFSIQPKGGESSDIHESISATVFNSKIDLRAKSDLQGYQAKLEIGSYWVDLEAFETSGDPLGKGAPRREISGEIIEVSSEKKEAGEYYDFLNKVTKKLYHYNTVEKKQGDFNIKTDSEGRASYSFNTEPGKFYKVKLKSVDDQGGSSYKTIYIYGNNFQGSARDYLSIKLPEDDSGKTKTFDLGETVEVKIEKNNSPLNSDSKGRFLFLEMNNGLMHWNLSSESNYSFEFSEKHLPNAYLSAMWFDGENYWPIHLSSGAQ